MSIGKWEREHEYEWTPTEHREHRNEFEKTLEPEPSPPPGSLQFFTREENEAHRSKQRQIDARFKRLIEEQQEKVERAKAKRDAAK